MKRFLIISSILLFLSLVIAAASYFWVISQLPPVNSTTDNQPVSVIATSSSSTNKAGEEPLLVVPSDGVPLRNLPLGDTQKSALETVGVDVETFVITPAMQTCAAEKLGTERMNEIIAGAAPSIIETTRLLPCLGAE